MSSTTTLRPGATDDATSPPNRRLRIALVITLVVVVAVFVTWLVAFSSALGVGTVSVRGTRVLSTADVRRAAGVAQNTPLVRVDSAAVTRRVEQLPEVASVQVETSFPSTVVITVVERQPVAYLRTGSGDELDALLDRTGYPFRTVHSRPANLPLIELAPSADGSSGTAEVRAGVAKVAAALPATLRARVRSVQALDPTAITLVLQRGKVVRWGSATRNADKARVVAVLIGRRADQIDVTDPDRPFTR